MIKVKRTPRHAALPPGCQDTVRESQSRHSAPRRTGAHVPHVHHVAWHYGRGGTVHDLRCFILRNPNRTILHLLASWPGGAW